MPIRAECECGKVYRVRDSLAGRRFRCTECGDAVPIPGGDDEPVVVAPAAPARRRSRGDDRADRPARRPVRSRPEPEEEEEPVRRRSRRRDEEPEAPEPHKDKKKRRGKGLLGHGVDARLGAVGGGLLAMLVGVMWFIASWLKDELLLYPIVLFVLGVVSVVKGLLGFEE